MRETGLYRDWPWHTRVTRDGTPVAANPAEPGAQKPPPACQAIGYPLVIDLSLPGSHYDIRHLLVDCIRPSNPSG